MRGSAVAVFYVRVGVDPEAVREAPLFQPQLNHPASLARTFPGQVAGNSSCHVGGLRRGSLAGEQPWVAMRLERPVYWILEQWPDRQGLRLANY